MTIGELLRQHLLADAAIAAVVVDSAKSRVFPLRLPQKVTLPAIVYTRISGTRYKHLRGAEALARPRYQIDCWALKHDDAVALGNLVRQRLNGFSGTWTDAESPALTVTVKILFEGENDTFEEEILGGLSRHSADYFIFHSTAEGRI